MTSAVDGGQPGWSKAGATLVNPIMYRLAKRWYEWFRTGVDEASPGAAHRRLVSPRLADATKVLDLAPFPFPRDRVRIENADMRKLPYDDEQFDFCWSCSSIEHVQTYDEM